MLNIRTGLKITYISFINELREIFKDAGVLLILVFAVIAYPIVYSIAYKNNVLTEIPVAIVDLDQTKSSRTLAKMINQTAQLDVNYKALSLNNAEKLFWEGKVNGIIVLPKDFEKDIYKGEQTDIVAYCDASYFLIYKETLNATLQASGTFSAGIEIRRNMSSGATLQQAIEQQAPLKAQFYNLYNPAGAYGYFVMPGLILVILQQTLLVGIGMIGGAGREKNNKKFVAPGVMLRNGVVSVITGKSLAYFLISIVNAIIALIWIHNWFSFPDKGSLFHVFLLMIPFILSTIFLGLTISLLFKKREMSIIFLVFLSPIVLFLTGLSWPSSSMPVLLTKIANIFPSTNMIPAYLRIRTMGVQLSDVKTELLFLIGQMLVYFILACISYKYLAKKHSIKQKETP